MARLIPSYSTHCCVESGFRLSQSVMLSALVLVVLPALCYGLGKTGYPCPTDCDCFVFPEDKDAVHVRCAIDVLSSKRFNFSVLHANDTSGLYIQCDKDISPHYTNHISNFMFSHLVHLKVLEFHDCQITDISRLALYGLTTLQKFRVVRAKHLTFAEDVFAELPSLKHLEITGSQFVYIPPNGLCDSHNLYKVNFTNSRVRVINEVGLTCVRPLASLLYMDFSQNFLTQLPEDFSIKFPKLQAVFLSNNRISKIQPGTFKNLKDLRLLSLSKNFLASLPQEFLMNSVNLSGIGLSGNELSRIPKGFLRRLPRLKIFEARNTFLGDSVWEEMLKSTSLEILDLSNSALTYINSTVMSNLRQLKRLVLSGNSIRELPNNVLQRQSKLELLYLRSNEITEIGKNSLVGLKSLQALTLYNNNISIIHNAAFRKLSNSLTQFLNLSSNALTKVPRAVSVLGKLVSLDISHNEIDSLDINSFEGLDSLLELHISNNILTYIPQNVFQKCPNLIILNIATNNISRVQNNAFGQLRRLRYVWLENNRLSDVGWVFTNIDNLQFLNVSNNLISEPVSPYLFPSTLEYLYLAGNQISTILDGSFENMNDLKLLDLRGNRLSVISSMALRVSLRNWQTPYLLLRGNPLSCICKMAWLKYLVSGNHSDASHYFQIGDYESLLCHQPEHLQFHFVSRTPYTDFVCYYTVNCLLRECSCCYFEGCDCKSVCPANCTCYHDQSWSVHMVNCQASGMTELPPFLPRTMTELRLDGNQLNNLDKHSFLARDFLSVIYLNNSQIQELDNKTFHGLPKLKVLYLNNNNIETLVSGVFNGLSVLEELYLDHNKLSFISQGVFDALFALKKLTLTDNALSNFESLMVNLPSASIQVYLADNPYSCACSHLDTIQEAINSFGSLVRDLHNLTCNISENDMAENISDGSYFLSPVQKDFSQRQRIIDVVSNLDTFCPNTTQSMVTSVSVGLRPLPSSHLVLIIIAVVVLVLTFIALFLFVKRKFIQVWLYTKFGMRLKRPNHKADQDKKYDAFISYSSKDEHFVVHELAPRLEQGNPSYKLCLHYRDFPVGASIAESIIEAVESSRRIILVLSTNFLQSEWCRFEFQSAHHQVLKDRLNRLIVILLTDIPFTKLDPDLKLYLKMNTYLKCGDPWFWEKLRFALPEIPKPKVNKNCKRKKKKGGQNGVGPSVYVVFGSSVSLHTYEEVQPV